MHTAFFSPFVVPVAAFAMVLGIVIVSTIAEYNKRKLASEERMAAIAKGVPLPPAEEIRSDGSVGPADPWRGARNVRRGGIITTAAGIGIILFSFVLTWIVQDRDVLTVAAAGLIPLLVGIGLLVDAAIEMRELRRMIAESDPSLPPQLQ